MGKFNEKVEKIQKENEGKLVLVKNGVFYNAIGKDALIVNEIFGNKLTCFGNGVCKCGIPASGMKSVVEEIKKRGEASNIYIYNKETGLVEEKMIIEGKSFSEVRKNKGCSDCEYGQEGEF